MNESSMLARYRVWLDSRQALELAEEHAPYFTQSVVILDANVLLDLYRYTEKSRAQVLDALSILARQRRLWLPHQVAIEFVRNREKAVLGRLRSLSAAGKAVDDRLKAAVRHVIEARNEVASLLRDVAYDDDTADNLIDEVDEASVKQLLAGLRYLFEEHLAGLKNAEYVTINEVKTDDPILPQIAKLFGDRIGAPFSATETQGLVQHAVDYRYPNRIPPGFADQDKGTDLARAGDYLLWEEIIRRATNLPEPRHLLFVSRDTKEDWYEQDDNGQPLRPWPGLYDEMHLRAGADLLILTPKHFLQGAQTFLGARLGEGTYDEVDRVSDQISRRLPALDSSLDAETIVDSLTLAKPFTLRTVASAPNAPGVHVVFIDDEAIYVGSTNNLRRRLRQHISGHRGSSVLHERVGQVIDTETSTASARQIAQWLGGCTVSWFEVDDREAAKDILVAAKNPRFNRVRPS